MLNEKFLLAQKELREEEFNKHFRTIFGNLQVLDFVETIVINLPGPCYCNCDFCMDKELRKSTNKITASDFMTSVEKVLHEFDVKNICITGGSLLSHDFNALIQIIKMLRPNTFVTWNTNGIFIDESYNIESIDRINLHVNALDKDLNRSYFKTKSKLLSIERAKALFKDKLFLRVPIIDSTFDLDEFVSLKIPLYLNRLLPGTEESNLKFKEVLERLHIDNVTRKRRNSYLDTHYKDVLIRVGLGDSLTRCVPGRYPTYLNVVIIHRSGIVTGTWFENDKIIYEP